MNYKLPTGAALSILLLAGCHSTRHEPWQDAKVAAPLTIPAGLDRPGTSSELTVPAQAASVEGAVQSNETMPPSSVNLGVEAAVDAAWQTVGSVLAGSGVGTILSRDDATHSLGIQLKGSELDLPKQGFFHRLVHRAPDLTRSYYAAVAVVDENGETQVQINGDWLAVHRVQQLLDGKLK
ncbi:MAG TPA: hypothetical protein VFN09_01655 [Rhodanobacteraceae bacterium]|nr:hypothetical protein [Rhodanobacteraceae bacterium]